MIEKKVNDQLQILLQHGFLKDDIYKLLKPIGSHLPQMYGLPKIHKQSVPLMPILAMLWHHRSVDVIIKTDGMLNQLRPIQGGLSPYQNVTDSLESCPNKLQEINPC